MTQNDDGRRALQEQIGALTGELVNSQDQMLALIELGRAMRHHVALRPGIAELARAAMRILKVSAVGIILDLADHPPLTAQYPEPDERSIGVDAPLLSDMLTALHRAGVDILRNDSHGGLGLLALPIVIRDEMAGALVCLGQADRQLGARERKVGRAIADQAGAHLENILLVEENVAQARLQTELDLARSVQTALLPRQAPATAQLDLWATALPARQVGGDSFDYLKRAEGDLYLIVSDVSGKGMPAALMMTTLRTTIRNALHFGGELSPAAVLGRCNEVLYDDFTDVGMFATLFIGCYSPERRALTFANAGHSPVIYRQDNGPARLLEAADVPVGVLPGGDFQAESVPLADGDLLLIGTDGLPEANNPNGDLFSYERLLEAVDTFAHLPASELGPALLAMVNEFAGEAPQADDQTLMVVSGVTK